MLREKIKRHKITKKAAQLNWCTSKWSGNNAPATCAYAIMSNWHNLHSLTAVTQPSTLRRLMINDYHISNSVIIINSNGACVWQQCVGRLVRQVALWGIDTCCYKLSKLTANTLKMMLSWLQHYKICCTIDSNNFYKQTKHIHSRW